MNRIRSKQKDNLLLTFLFLMILAEIGWITSWQTYRDNTAKRIQQQNELARSEFVRAFHLAK